MPIKKAKKKPGSSANRASYRISFLGDAHRLIARGYARMTPANHSNTVEEDITDLLVREINAAIAVPGADAWMKRYDVVDDLHVPHPTRRGKRRPRVDVQISYTKRYPWPRLHFEAKRLGPGNAVGKYTGRTGLGCILAGDYARTHDDAGMLGYVQSDTCADWAKKIETKLHGDRAGHELVAGTNWRSMTVTPELSTVYLTNHTRVAIGKPVDVYHTFLLFC
jgi:hypothetical protein